jgi:hypothetical protein
MEVRPLHTLSVIAFAMAGCVVVPSSASAAGWNCSASVLTGQPTGTPLAANDGGATCVTASAGGNTPPLPSPLQAGAASANTSLDGPAADPAAQRATATAQLTGLDIGIPTNLPIDVPTTMLLGVDITSALRALVPVPSGPLVGVQAASATASGQCANGSPQLTGSSSTTGVSALGQALPTNQVVQQAVDVVSATTVDPSVLSLSSLPAPLNSMSSLLIQPLLDALPNVAVPATVAQVGVTPGTQTVVGDTLTQRGPQLTVTVAGQPLADLALGQASVSSGGVNCARDADRGDVDDGDAPTGGGGPGGGGAVPLAQLACTSRKLALIDVLARGGYARLQGVADLRYVGRRVEVVSRWNGKVVARAIVLADGTLQARGALPPKSLRTSNRARYEARIGSERSLDLKLFRRMLVEQMSSSDGDVTIKGRIVGPLGKPRRAITIKRRVSCTKDVTVKAVRPDASGRFAVSIPAPPTGQAAVYRLQTSVPRSARNPKLFATFTLPRAVELRR